MTYSDKLKDPRWQKKRLEIMQRDDFECSECRSKKKTLNVHHFQYERGLEPWEAEDYNLITLCENCHIEYHKNWKPWENLLIKSLRKNKYQFIFLKILTLTVKDLPVKKWMEPLVEMLDSEGKKKHEKG